ncbi:MAG TPA: cadherin domain-containing protein, partial [Phycisphaerae bacterium]|nr:cadherin domain-containing protein [Phycisphaerae bacterium]
MNKTTCRTGGAACLEPLEERLLLAVSAEAQMFVYLLNQARHDPAAYAAEAGLAVTLAGVAPQQPLAVNSDLFDSAEFHAGEMAANDYFAHQSAVTADWPNKMARDAGYALPAAWLDAANNIESIDGGLADADDTLNRLLENGGADPLDTGAHLLATDVLFGPHREIGVGHATDGGSALVEYWAVHTAYTDAAGPIFTGIVYSDTNANDLYDLGEGLANVSITNGTDTAQTNAHGGWSMPSDGTTQILICSGGAFAGAGVVVVNAAQMNTEIDFVSGDTGGIVNFGDTASQAPGVPYGVSATDGTNTTEVTVSWYAVAGAGSYEVWRHTVDNSAGATQLDSVIGTTYHDTAAVAGTAYFYWVKARNAIGTSGFSYSDAGRRNNAPTVGTHTALPDPVDLGANVTLTATDLADVDGIIGWVLFHRDADGSGTFDAAIDTAIGWGNVVNGTATYTTSTASLGYGVNRFFARACDSDQAFGPATAAVVTVNNPDPVAPAAALAANDITVVSAAPYQFTVTYTDNVAINLWTVGYQNVRVTGPNGYDQPAWYSQIDTWTNGSPRTVTYGLYGPNWNWHWDDNGTYTVSMGANGVADTNGNSVPAGALGTFDVAINNPDPVAPAAALAANDITTVSTAPYAFTVTYTDNVAVNLGTVGYQNVRVTGPNGYDQLAWYSQIDNWTNGSPRTVTYCVYGPNWNWHWNDNGTYTVSMEANQVADTNGNPVPAGALGTFDVNILNPDPVAPTAALAANDVTIPTGAPHAFTVTYTDNVAVNLWTVGYQDVRVTGPNGYDQPAWYSQIDNWTNGSPRTVTYCVYGPGWTWDFTDNGTYTVSMEANGVTDTNGNPVPAGVLGTFDANIPDKPDLTVAFNTIWLPDVSVPGESAWVSATMTNTGGVTAVGTITNNLWFSADQALGGDTLFKSQQISIWLAPGASQAWWLTVPIPGDATPGTGYLLADIDATNVITEVHEDNNLAASAGTYDVAWQFGAVGTRSGVNLTVDDADSTPVTFSLWGPGTGTVSVGAEGLDVELTGTTTGSYVSISTPWWGAVGDGEATLGDVTVGDPADPGDDTPLGYFYATTSNLAGDFTLTGTLASLYLDDVSGERTLTIGAAANPWASVYMTFDRVQDFSVNSQTPIGYLNVADWLDTGGADDTVTAPTLGYYSARGNWYGGIQGNSQVNLTLTDGAAAQTLGTVYIAGWLDGAQIRSARNTGAMTLGGIRNGLVFGGINAGVNDLPDALGDFDTLLATIGGVYVTGITGEANSWINSSVAAGTVNYVYAKDILYANGATPHGIATQSLGSLYYYDDTLWYWWPNGNPLEVNGPLPRQDFTVNLQTFGNGAPSINAATFAVDENSANGTNVGTPLPVTDPDAVDTTAWTITGGNGAGVFAIHADTGQITVTDNSTLDFETTPQYVLTVRVTDSGGLWDEAAVTVNVGDVNETPDIGAATFAVDEDAANGTNVGAPLAVTDP